MASMKDRSQTLRRGIKVAAAFGLRHSPLAGLIVSGRRAFAGGRRVVILGYHRVCDDFETERRVAIESCLISRDTFRRHVEYLSGRFELASMSRAVDVLSGRERAHRDLAVITFDDGYEDVLANALPVLREHGAPATIYVSSGVIERGGFFPHDRLFTLLDEWSRDGSAHARTDRRSFDLIDAARREVGHSSVRSWLTPILREVDGDAIEQLCSSLGLALQREPVPARSARALTWDGVRALAAAGWEIGAHTVSHRVLPHDDVARIEREVRSCRDAIEAQVGVEPRHFAYCNGHYNDAVIGALRRAGYASAVTTEDRLNRVGADPFLLARRCLWEGSSVGPMGRASTSLISAQLDDVWASVQFDACVSGRRPEPPSERASS